MDLNKQEKKNSENGPEENGYISTLEKYLDSSLSPNLIMTL